jgi:hypothetical protein
MYYIIYQTVCLVNQKIYIGKHQTHNLDDGYLGSGKLLKRAIKRYGETNFKREVLFIYDNEEDMNKKEAELINESFVSEKNNYNLCVGGQGGFGYINKNNLAGLANKNKITVRHKQTGKHLKIMKNEIENYPEYEFIYKNTVVVIDDEGKKFRVSLNDYQNSSNFKGHTSGFTHAVNTLTGQKEYVQTTDSRFQTGELIGNNKNTHYYNDGKKTYRLKSEHDPKIKTLNLQKGRLLDVVPRKWYNDGTTSFFLTENDNKTGLLPGRILKRKNA